MTDLSIIPLDLLEAQLEACIKTRDLHQRVVDGEYARYEDTPDSCFLCAVADTYNRSLSGICCSCPHVWFIGHSCTTYSCVEGPIYLDSSASIIRLSNWIEEIRVAIKEKL